MMDSCSKPSSETVMSGAFMRAVTQAWIQQRLLSVLQPYWYNSG